VKAREELQQNSHLAFKMIPMPAHPLQEQIAQRVERLLLRYEELQRTNALLIEQVAQLSRERDQFKSRLETARHRIDALLDRLPEEINTRENK
jgi:uncharacterized protein (TIGR02449 family)